VRAADFAELSSLLEAAEALETERENAFAEAQEQVDAAHAEAESRVAAALAEAKEAGERGYREGLALGREEAAANWAASALRDGASTKHRLSRQTDRLSTIVALAVERIVEHEDRAALYRQALRTIHKLLKDAPMLTLRVSESERDSAQRAIDSVSLPGNDAPLVELVGDATLAPGSCVFESDMGVVDASLETQLAAVKRAIERAAREVMTSLNAARGGIDTDSDANADHDTDSETDVDPESVASTKADAEASVTDLSECADL